MVDKKGVWMISGPSSTVYKCDAVLTGTDASGECAISFYRVYQSKKSQLLFLECRP